MLPVLTLLGKNNNDMLMLISFHKHSTSPFISLVASHTCLTADVGEMQVFCVAWPIVFCGCMLASKEQHNYELVMNTFNTSSSAVMYLVMKSLQKNLRMVKQI